MIPGVHHDDGTPSIHHDHRKPVPIAIIGLGCRLPAGATNVESFWAEIANGESGWAPHPANRYDAEKYYHPDPDKKGSFNAKGAHYLKEDVALFDAQFFNVTVAEAIVQLYFNRVNSQTNDIVVGNGPPAASSPRGQLRGT